MAFSRVCEPAAPSTAPPSPCLQPGLSQHSSISQFIWECPGRDRGWPGCGHADGAAGHTAVPSRGMDGGRSRGLFLLQLGSPLLPGSAWSRRRFSPRPQQKSLLRDFLIPPRPWRAVGGSTAPCSLPGVADVGASPTRFLFPPGEPHGTWRLHPVNHPATPDLFQTHQLWGLCMGYPSGSQDGPAAQGLPNSTIREAQQADEDTAGASPSADAVVTLLQCHCCFKSLSSVWTSTNPALFPW